MEFTIDKIVGDDGYFLTLTSERGTPCMWYATWQEALHAGYEIARAAINQGA